MHIPVFALLLIVLGQSGCAPRDAVVDRPESIRFEARGCYGNCPAFRMAIFRDGAATFVGLDHSAARGEHRFRVPPATFRRFAEALEPLRPARGSIPRRGECNRGDGPSYLVAWVAGSGVEQSVCLGDHDETGDPTFVRARMAEALGYLSITRYIGREPWLVP